MKFSDLYYEEIRHLHNLMLHSSGEQIPSHLRITQPTMTLPAETKSTGAFVYNHKTGVEVIIPKGYYVVPEQANLRAFDYVFVKERNQWELLVTLWHEHIKGEGIVIRKTEEDNVPTKETTQVVTGCEKQNKPKTNQDCINLLNYFKKLRKQMEKGGIDMESYNLEDMYTPNMSFDVPSIIDRVSKLKQERAFPHLKDEVMDNSSYTPVKPRRSSVDLSERFDGVVSPEVIPIIERRTQEIKRCKFAFGSTAVTIRFQGGWMNQYPVYSEDCISVENSFLHNGEPHTFELRTITKSEAALLQEYVDKDGVVKDPNIVYDYLTEYYCPFLNHSIYLSFTDLNEVKRCVSKFNLIPISNYKYTDENDISTDETVRDINMLKHVEPSMPSTEFDRIGGLPIYIPSSFSSIMSLINHGGLYKLGGKFSISCQGFISSTDANFNVILENKNDVVTSRLLALGELIPFRAIVLTQVSSHVKSSEVPTIKQAFNERMLLNENEK